MKDWIKNNRLKLTAALCMAAVVVFGNLAVAEADTASSSEETYGMGLLTEELPEDYDEEVSDTDDYSADENTNGSSLLPTAYLSADLNMSNLFPEISDTFTISEKSRITAVKNQSSYNLCYVFAGIGAMESSVLSKYDVTAEDLNLSELQTAYYNLHRDEKSNPKGTEGDTVDSGDASKNEKWWSLGGNDTYLALSLMRWVGATDEETAPYTDLLSGNLSDQLLNGELSTSQNRYVLRNWEYVAGSNTEAIKQKILEYGSGVCWVYYDQTHNANYDTEHDAMYNANASVSNQSNHEGLIVGWDDNYPKENFRSDKSQPKNDGAFLVRNSWGDSTNRSGYYWLSYEDFFLQHYKNSGKTYNNNVYFYDMISVDEAETINHQYDGGMWNGYLSNYNYTADDSQLMTESVKTNFAVGETASMANVFTADVSEELKSVAVYTMNAGLKCHISIYKDVKDDPTDGTLVAEAETDTTIPYAGYHTIELSSAVTLKAGEKFSVVVTLSRANKGYIYLTYEAGSSNYTSAVAMNEGESFFKIDGTTWTDLKTWANTKSERTGVIANVGNFHIKALAVADAKEATPEPTEEPSASPEPTATPEPTIAPTVTATPTVKPTVTPNPTIEPTVEPTAVPTATPTVEPTNIPTPTPNPTQEKVTKRIGGDNRYETAIQTVKEAYPDGTEQVIIVKSSDFPDGLSASAYAGTVDAPILLSGLNEINANVKELLSGKWGENLKKVTVIGGGFSAAFYEQLEAATGLSVNDGTIENLAGENRFETAEEVCKAILNNENYTGDACVLATGLSPADALSISSWCATYQMPILLTDRTLQLKDDSRKLLSRFKTIYIVGGDVVVNDEYVNMLAENGQKNVIRLSGSDRYKTSVAISKYFTARCDEADTIAFSSGEDTNFPDALVSAPLVGKKGGSILLVSLKYENKNSVVYDYLSKYNIDQLLNIYVMGSDKLIGNETFKKFCNILLDD